jgi:hypothetical protein
MLPDLEFGTIVAVSNWDIGDIPYSWIRIVAGKVELGILAQGHVWRACSIQWITRSEGLSDSSRYSERSRQGFGKN